MRLVRWTSKIGFKDEYFLILLSIVIGAATGVFANVFYRVIEYAGEFVYGNGADGSHAGLYRGRVWMLVVLPVVGALAVGFITRYFAREAKGHGVPEVMDAILRKGGEIRPRVAGAKAVASALTIGSGGSAGTEGPIVQIGAAIGSSVGQFLRIDRKNMSVLVACGVAAGISAIFNAPIAGVMFALEIFLRDFSFRVFSPVVFASVISCSIMHALRASEELQDVAIFEVHSSQQAQYVFAGAELPYFLILGIMAAVAAVMFIRALYFTEDVADLLNVPEVVKPAIGAICLGVLGVVYVLGTNTGGAGAGMPPFFGNGYPLIQQTIGPDIFKFGASGLLVIFVLKTLATCFTLGSGGSGGVFAPSLLLGATLGGAFGLTLHQLGLVQQSSVTAYALVGMAAMVAGTTHAPLTAIVMLYEITREPKVILPVMFAAIIATAGAQLISRDSIYTLKLRRRGVRLGSLADLTILKRISIKDVDTRPVPTVMADDPLQKLLDLAGTTDSTDFIVVDEEGKYQGMVVGQDVRTALLQPESVSLLLVGELLRPGVPALRPDETLDVVLDKFAHNDVSSLPVCHPDDGQLVTRLVTRQAVMRRYHEELDRQMH